MRLGDELRRLDRRAIGAIFLVAVVLALEEYYGDQPFFRTLFPDLDSEGWGLVWWAGAKLLGFFVLPIFVIALWRDRPSEYGLRLGSTRAHWRAYVVCYLVVLPLVIGASFTSEFQATYPFLREAPSASALLGWELLYGSTLVALEFFFRGWALFSVERAIGAYAPFVLAVPYAMIHFGKPIAEVLGAIVAGVVLGWLARVTRSIWGGVAVHLAVAWTMDLLAILQRKVG